jgi:hypothetical protein
MDTNYFNYKWQERRYETNSRKINAPKLKISGTYIELKLIKEDIEDDYLLLCYLLKYFYCFDHIFDCQKEFIYDVHKPDPLQSYFQGHKDYDDITIVICKNKVGIFIKNCSRRESFFCKDGLFRVNSSRSKKRMFLLQKERPLSLSISEYIAIHRKIEYRGQHFIAEKIYNYLAQR